MQTLDDTANIKQARKELKRWGKFWQRFNFEQGSVSLTACFIQNQKSATKYHRRRPIDQKTDARRKGAKGTERPYTADCSPTRGGKPDNDLKIFVPWDLRDIDDLIESMQPECATALRNKYIYETDEKGVWLDRAERIVLFSL